MNQVKEQYEAYPYPLRNPEDERTRPLIKTSLDHKAKIRHYCWRGSAPEKPRILVMGGGTGDGAIYLASQFPEASIDYVDLSKASMEIAQKRAEIRGFKNIDFYNCGIFDLHTSTRQYDYINCVGMLHHLSDPAAGLKHLKSMLAPDGGLGIMVYGLYGRKVIYELQSLFKSYYFKFPDHTEFTEFTMEQKIKLAKELIESLPGTHPIKQYYAQWSKELESDNGIYDLFLHSQDRAYTVDQLYNELIGDLNLVEFIGEGIEGQLSYRLDSYIKPGKLLDNLSSLSKKQQQAIAELMTGQIKKHCFYLSKQTDTICPFDEDSIIVPHNFNPWDVCTYINNNPGKDVNIEIRGVQKIVFTPGINTRFIFRFMNSKRTIGQMLKNIKRETGVSRKKILPAIEEIFKMFNLQDYMFLRQG